MQQNTGTTIDGTYRTRALKVALSAALGIGLLAGSAVAATAQEPLLTGSAPEYAGQDDGAFPFDELPIHYTWEAGEWPEDTHWGTFDESTGAMIGLFSGPIAVTASDPRFSGDVWLAANGQSEGNGSGSALVESRSFRTVDELCSWTGTSTFVLFGTPPEPPSLMREMYVATGAGVCEGLTQVSTGDYAETNTGEAIIFANPLPPVPAFPTVPTANAGQVSYAGEVARLIAVSCVGTCAE